MLFRIIGVHIVCLLCEFVYFIILRIQTLWHIIISIMIIIIIFHWRLTTTSNRGEQMRNAMEATTDWKLECAPMPNVMAALPNTVAAPSVQRRKVWLMPTTGVPCTKAAKTRNPLKLAGCPKTSGPISAASGPKFTILWRHLEEMLLVIKFFPIVNACLSCKDIAR